MPDADFEVFADNVIASLRDHFVEAGQSEENSQVPISGLIFLLDGALQQEKWHYEREFPFPATEETNATFRIFSEGVCTTFVDFLMELSIIADLNQLSFANVRNGLDVALGVESRGWFDVYGEEKERALIEL